MYLVHRSVFDLDFLTIRQLGITRSFDEFRSEIDSFRYDNRLNSGFLRRTLRVRVSGRRLMNLVFKLPLEMTAETRAHQGIDLEN
jgi:hypothetical protein